MGFLTLTEIPDFSSVLNTTRRWINMSCIHLEAWQVIAYSVVGTLITIYLWDLLTDDCVDRLKNSLFRTVRKIPVVKRRIDREMVNVIQHVSTEIRKDLDGPFLQSLPSRGWSPEQVLSEVRRYMTACSDTWGQGKVSGAVYSGRNQDLDDMVGNVYRLSAWSNPLHPDVFPGVRKMEAEIVRMTLGLFNAAPSACGVVTSGGSESIFLACKAYRDYARQVKGIRNPVMIIPVTAHAAFDKAAQILSIKVVHIPFDPVNMKVDVTAMARAVGRRTCMLVGSAPQFPHGIIDPIEEIAQLGLQHDIPVHVDACLGGFLLPFMDKASFPVGTIDFRVAGVTSISADTHKYAFAPKGTSVIMYRHQKYRHRQYCIQPNWPGGIYGSSTIAGSRAGGIIATCWAVMLYFGTDGYTEATRKIVSIARYITKSLQTVPGIFVYGQPEMSVIAIGSHEFSIYRLSDALNKCGWHTNILQFPSGLHFCVTLRHTENGVADEFIRDVQNSCEALMKDPKLPDTGKAAIYGMSQQIPDRNLVTEMAWAYLDAYYSTEPAENINYSD